MNFVNEEVKKMENSARKMTKREKQTRKARRITKTFKEQAKAAEYVGYLLELHKLQGILLTQLHKEVR
jgi:hypothetical protein